MNADEIVSRLRQVRDPCCMARGLPHDIVEFGLVDEVHGGPEARVVLRLTEPTCLYRAWFHRRLRSLLGPDVAIEFTAADEMWEPPDLAVPVPAPRRVIDHGATP